jgi:hypothetical protein
MPTTTALMIDAGNSSGREFSMILASTVILIAQYSAASIIASA